MENMGVVGPTNSCCGPFEPGRPTLGEVSRVTGELEVTRTEYADVPGVNTIIEETAAPTKLIALVFMP